MIYLYLVTTLVLCGVAYQVWKTDQLIKDFYHQFTSTHEKLASGIQNTHSQIINTEKIIREMPQTLRNAESILSVMGTETKEIHNVCVWLSKEIQEAREASKKQV